MDAKLARIQLVESLREGDIIRWNGRLRVIRDVTKGEGKGWRRISFTFSIQRCSWTGKPYTVYSRTDMQNLKKSLELVARNYKGKLPLEKLLTDDIKQRRGMRCKLECCDVVGVVN
jgi:hypothetical protein